MAVEMVLAQGGIHLFLLPLSFHPFRFSLVFSPDFLESKQGLTEKDPIVLYCFEGCTKQMKNTVLYELTKILEEKRQELQQKRFTRIFGGGALVLAGVIDFFIFDPSFIDELLILAGGIFALRSGLLKGKLPPVPSAEKIEQQVCFQEHPLLTYLSKMLEQLGPHSEIDEEDVLGDLEFYLQTLFKENQQYINDLAFLCEGYKSQAMLNQLSQLEQRIQTKKISQRKRLKLLKDKSDLESAIKSQLQISQAALVLYGSLLRIKENIAQL